MKTTRKINTFHILLTYFFIPLFSSFLGMIFIMSSLDLVYTQMEMSNYYLFIKEHPMANLVTLILPYLLSICGYILLSIPTWKIVQNQKNNIAIPDKCRVRLLNAPLQVSIISFGAWISQSIAQIIIFSSLGFTYFLSGIIKNIIVNTIIGSITFLIVYYILDTISTYIFIPAVIKKGEKLSRIKGLWNVSIKGRFSFFLVAVCINPMIMFGLSLFNLNQNLLKLSDSSNYLSMIIILISGFFITSVVLTLYLARSIQRPLVRMETATKMIESGKFDINLRTLHSDELGKLGESLKEMAVELKEKELIKDTFGKVVDPTVRDYLLSGNLDLGGKIQNATILFSDIRSFTSLSEKLNPTELVILLNRYFNLMSECITEEYGFVNKFIGDAVMAIFGLPVPYQDHAQAAVRAALKMREARDLLNKKLKAEGSDIINTGIGIHTGDVLAGNIGSTSRMEFTVIGDTVNVASRLEGLCKEKNRDLIISHTTKSKLEDKYHLVELGNVTVKGRKEPVNIYSL